MVSSTTSKYAGILAIAGFGDILLALVLYWLLMDIAWVRSTALPSIALIVGGLLVGGLAVYQRRSIVTIAPLALSLTFSGLFLFLIFGMTRLPEATAAPPVGQRAPEFAIPNQLGQTVALADLHKDGPALLVFYRGHW